MNLSSIRLSGSSYHLYLWNSRSGHVFASRLYFLVSTGALRNLNSNYIFYCSDFKLAKFSALPFSKSIFVSLASFDLVHSGKDRALCAQKRGLAIMFLLLMISLVIHGVYLMKRKYEFLEIFLILELS